VNDEERTAEEWDAARVRRLRDAIGDSQQAFAERLGTRQQTVSEWERGSSRPRRMARRLLQMVAEEHGFYEVGEQDVREGSEDS
jgi:DNA-binding transcriptional regulator YiaG